MLRGNPRSGSTRSDDDVTFNVVVPPGGIVLEHMLAGGDKRRSGVTSTARPMVDPSGMSPRRFSDGRVLDMDSRRRRKLSGVMVVLMAERPGKVGASVLLRGWTEGRWR